MVLRRRDLFETSYRRLKDVCVSWEYSQSLNKQNLTFWAVFCIKNVDYRKKKDEGIISSMHKALEVPKFALYSGTNDRNRPTTLLKKIL